MKTDLLKTAALLILVAGGLQAQTFTPPLTASSTGTNPVDFEFRLDGTLIAKGNYGVGSLLSTDQGAGTRLLWYPALAAFRAGNVTATKWDLANIGTYSAAFGYDTKASGQYSTATGAYSNATGMFSTAVGYVSNASNAGSTAAGYYSTASGPMSTAVGESTMASGYAAAATGRGTMATGSSATAMGGYSIASGDYSTAMGYFTTANSYNGFVIGRYNVDKSATNGTPSTTSWVGEDPLLEVGNGTGPSAKSSALVVYKNGDIKIPKPQGDISMGEFAP